MANINFTQKKYNGSTWDTLYPKTVGAQVIEDATHRWTTDTEKATWNGKATKISGGTNGNIVTRDATGEIADSGKHFDDAGTTTGDIWTASKVQSAIDTATSGIAGQLKPGVADLTALKAIDTTSSTTYPDKCMINCETLGLYRLDRDSAVAGDDNRIVAPTAGVGRWFKMSATINDHNNLSNIQGGASGDYYHLTSAQQTRAIAVSLFTVGTTQPGSPATGDFWFDTN